MEQNQRGVGGRGGGGGGAGGHGQHFEAMLQGNCIQQCAGHYVSVPGSPALSGDHN